MLRGLRPALASLALASEEAFGFRCYTQGKLFMKTEKKKKKQHSLRSCRKKKKHSLRSCGSHNTNKTKQNKTWKKKHSLRSCWKKKTKPALASLVLAPWHTHTHTHTPPHTHKKKTPALASLVLKTKQTKKNSTRFTRAGPMTHTHTQKKTPALASLVLKTK